MPRTRATIRIGISGWRYAPWRGVFYPADLRQDDELAYAARRFHSVEINGTFYSLQRPEWFDRWRDATPPGFVFAVKGPRFITHTLRLQRFERPLANFFASGVLRLRDRLGPMLWQLPPTLRFDASLLEDFLAFLPRSTQAAASLARRRDVARMKGRSALATDADRPLRHALEVRHASFLVPDCIALLRRHGVALVIADTAGKYPYSEDVTADVVYVRLHGDTQLYASGYGPAALDRWAERIRTWAGGGEPDDAVVVAGTRPPRPKPRDVYCYFDNDAKVRAPFDALALIRRPPALSSALL